MSEFCLSSKEFHSLNGDKRAFYKEDVKNFIRELKEKLIGFKTQKIQGEIINELAGDALVSKEVIKDE